MKKGTAYSSTPIYFALISGIAATVFALTMTGVHSGNTHGSVSDTESLAMTLAAGLSEDSAARKSGPNTDACGESPRAARCQREIEYKSGTIAGAGDSESADANGCSGAGRSGRCTRSLQYHATDNVARRIR